MTDRLLLAAVWAQLEDDGVRNGFPLDRSRGEYVVLALRLLAVLIAALVLLAGVAALVRRMLRRDSTVSRYESSGTGGGEVE